MSTSPKTIATVHEFHLHYSDFYDCGFKSLVMVAFVNGFFNPESRKIFVKGAKENNLKNKLVNNSYKMDEEARSLAIRFTSILAIMVMLASFVFNLILWVIK